VEEISGGKIRYNEEKALILAGCVVLGIAIEDCVSRVVYYSLCKGSMGGGEYGYGKWCYSLECNVHSTCS
jgi:hypothetical protein